METAVIHVIVLGIISGLTSGSNVLPDGPLHKAVGENVKFNTAVPPTESQFGNILWRFNGNPITVANTQNYTKPEYEDRITLFPSTGSLELRNLVRNDSGEYSVSITEGFNEHRGITTLHVHDVVTDVELTASSTDVVEGSSISLSCSVSSGSSLSFLWTNHSSELTAGDRVQLSDENSTLTINPVNRYDRGPFRCHVSNPVSNGTSDPINLTISYGPENTNLSVTPSQEHYAVGSDIDLSCSADSRPDASFTWFLNGDQLPGTGPKLRLTNIQERQSGDYTCRSFNNKTMNTDTSLELSISVLERISDASITPSPNQGIVGNSLNLTCDAAGSVFTRKWMKDGSDLTLAEHMTFYEENRVLSFKQLKKTDGGEYSCEISNPVSSMKATYSLVVNYVVTDVELTASSPDVVEGSSISLSCSVSSGSSLSFLWANHSSELTAGDRVQLSDENSTLTINPVNRYDRGPFRCHVSNPVSNGTSDPINLTISYGPENTNLSVTPSQEHYAVGSDISLSCSAGSRPDASFTWFLNGDQLPGTGPELRLTNIQERQSGDYTCRSFNDKTMNTDTSMELSISVLERISDASIKPSPNQAIEGNSVNLTCDAAGSVFTRKWMKGGFDLILSDHMTFYEENRVLSFQPVQRTDRGEYSCEISNPISSMEATHSLVVNYGAENVEITGQNKFLYGDTIRLTCSAESVPSATYTWSLNGTEIHDDAVYTKTYAEFSDTGTYTCEAKNNITGGSKSALHELTITEFFTDVEVTANSTDLVEGSSVSLSCRVSSGSFLSFFSILSFRWTNGSSELTASDRVQLTNGDSALTINPVNRYDQGSFSCHVYHPSSNGSSDPVSLAVSYGPEKTKLSITPSQEHYAVGSDISLSCSADSRPDARFTWFLNGDQLPGTGSELRLTNIQERQSGDYTCRSFNNKTMNTDTSLELSISVLERISDASVTPSPNQAMEGNSVNLTCDAAGSVFTRKWMKDGSDLTLAEHMTFYEENRVLSFQPVQRTDRGEYSCKISNPISSTEATHSLVVNYGPEKVYINGLKVVQVGDTFTFTCSAESEPPPSYTWSLNGKEIHGSAVYTKKEAAVTDSGTYTCDAKNNITGRTSSAVHDLNVTDVADEGLSAGAIAGIVVACLLVVLFPTGGYFIYKKKFKLLRSLKPMKSVKLEQTQTPKEENIYETISKGHFDTISQGYYENF